MRKWKNILMSLGIVILIWGVFDFYNLISIWTKTFQYYVGTNNETIIRELGKYQFESALIKTIFGVFMMIIAVYRTKKH